MIGGSSIVPVIVELEGVPPGIAVVGAVGEDGALVTVIGGVTAGPDVEGPGPDRVNWHWHSDNNKKTVTIGKAACTVIF